MQTFTKKLRKIRTSGNREDSLKIASMHYKYSQQSEVTHREQGYAKRK